MSGNILILSAGRRVSLVKAFQQAVNDLSINSDVICADMKPIYSSACQVSKHSVTLPHCLDSNYIDELLTSCQTLGVKLVVPLIDTELKTLSKNKDKFSAHGITIAVSDHELVTTCRDKRLTNNMFSQIGFPVPTCYQYNDIVFPCFSKPISGSLSQNIRILNNREELDSWAVDHQDMMFMEIVSADEFDEYTIDIYYSANSVIKCIVPRKRLEVRGGEVSKALTDKSLLPLIKPIMDKLTGAFGCLTLQVFKHKTEDKLFGIEINPRFGGGFPLTNLAGATYPKWLIEEVILNKNIDYCDTWQDQLMMLRYDAEVLVDCR